MANRGGAPSQDQERGLEGILGVVVVAQYLAAHPLHHRTVPLDQRREGCFLTMGHEPVEQLPIGEANNRADLEKRLKVTTCTGVMSIGHESGSRFGLHFWI
jgi:hypothetical protein